MPWRIWWGCFLRSLAVQGSFNYRTLIGGGFAFALLPVLRFVYRDDPEALRAAIDRHTGLFNSHPYLASMAVGAVARLELEGRDDAVVQRFKMAVRGSLGTLGDRVFWAGWRPLCLLAALALAVLGARWWVVVGGFLLSYNVGHLGLRIAGFRMGSRRGMELGGRIRRLPLGKAQRVLTIAGVFVTGIVLALLVARSPVPMATAPGGRLAWGAGTAVAAVLGIVFGPRVRNPLAGVLAGTVILAILLGVA